MLIKCPECGKEISDKSKVCIHCGYPLENLSNNVCNINNTEYDLSDIIELLPRVGNRDTDISPLHIAGIIRDKTQLDFRCAKQLADAIIQTKSIPEQFDGEISIKIQQPNVPKCPTCNSTKVKRISGSAKVTGAAMFGLFSKTARSQFKCENCGYKW